MKSYDDLIDHDEYLNKRLQNPEFLKAWLKDTILEYVEDGNYNEFYRALEQVIKARGTVKEFAEHTGIDRSNLIDLLHGKTKTAPSITTITKILNGLGYTLSIDDLKTA